MVAPLLEVLLLRVLRRRATGTIPAPPTRLASAARRVDSLGHVLDGTTVLLAREDGPVQVLGAGSLVWPPLLTRGGATYVVLTHDPVEVWMRIGPFDTADGRTVEQVELRLTVSLTDSASGLADLLEGDALAQGRVPSGSRTDRADRVDRADRADRPDGGDGTGAGRLEGFGDRLLQRLAAAVSSRTADAVQRRTLDELADLSVRVVLDEALPTSFLGGTVVRTSLEVVDVDWPTEGRSRPYPPLVPGGAGAPRTAALPRTAGPTGTLGLPTP